MNAQQTLEWLEAQIKDACQKRDEALANDGNSEFYNGKLSAYNDMEVYVRLAMEGKQNRYGRG